MDAVARRAVRALQAASAARVYARRVALAVLPQPFNKRHADPFGLWGDPAGAGMGVQQEPGAAFAIKRHAAAFAYYRGVGLSDTRLSSQAIRAIGGRAGFKVIALSPRSTRASG